MDISVLIINYVIQICTHLGCFKYLMEKLKYRVIIRSSAGVMMSCISIGVNMVHETQYRDDCN